MSNSEERQVEDEKKEKEKPKKPLTEKEKEDKKKEKERKRKIQPGLKIKLQVEDFTQQAPNFGEIFIINDETQGACECLEHFKGKQILSFGGGIISSLHAPEFDDYDFTFTEHEEGNQKAPNEIFEAFDNKGPLKKIISGKKHLVFLTGDGKLYSYGYGEYGALGQGGISICAEPKLVKTISDKSIIQIACGEYHTLALTNNYDLYSWGRGFEGQLGLSYKVKVDKKMEYKFSESVSSPTFVSFFYQQPITQISCGAYHSMAIDWRDHLYGWGEAKLGQVGCGKKMKEIVPHHVRFSTKQLKESQIRIEKFKQKEGEKQVLKVSCGYGHTCAVLKDGSLWSWGFNVKGQLGLGDKKSRFYPEQIITDILLNNLPKFITTSCGYFNSFAIDETGKAYAWGGGNLGQKNVIYCIHYCFMVFRIFNKIYQEKSNPILKEDVFLKL